MSVNWETLKSALGSYWGTSSIYYVNEEGQEVPIENDKDFQEALRVAKINKKRLKLIFYVKNSQKMFMTLPESVRIFNSSENNEDLSKNSKIYPSVKENICPCCGSDSGDAPPEWFTQYMKKFEKDLLHNLKSYVLDVIDSTIKKEALCQKSDAVDCVSEKNEVLFSPLSTHTKKKKKVSEKSGVDFSDHRDLKLAKRLEKLHSIKSERLEKLENKTKMLFEEKKKLPERKRHSKSKLEKNILVAFDKKNSQKKSASFRENGAYLLLNPGEEFTYSVNITNDGKRHWSSPRLECFESTGLWPHESSINLPRLLPNESCCVTLRGKAGIVPGTYCFKCEVVDDLEKISREFTCSATVHYLVHFDKNIRIHQNPKNEDVAAAQSGNPVEKLIDFDKDVIASSKKKIEENIIEIERRLQYMDLLRPSTSGEANLKKNPVKAKKVSDKKPEPQTESCDLSQNLEEKEKNWTKRLEQEEVLFGVDCLKFASESNEACRVKTNPQNPQTDVNLKAGKLENTKKDCESDSSSDSELSVIFMSEEEENFIIVPLIPKSPSPAESVHEDKKCLATDSEDKNIESNKQKKSVVGNEGSAKPEIKNDIQEEVSRESNTVENLSPSQLTPTRSRRSPFGEEFPKSKLKKMKSRSTEYHFTTANLTQPIFTPIPDGFYLEKPSRFNFTGEKEEGNSSEGVFEFSFAREKVEKTQKDDLRGKNVPKTDASGRIIYAVNNKGHCLPVGELFENGESSRGFREETEEQEIQNRHEKRNDRFNEIPAVNILPNVLMHGASNVASLAFNTAKSVISNLQSAFVTEGKTELGKPAYEDKKKVSMECMFKLYQMGFSDLQINRKLLLWYDNDLTKVIEELVRLEENSSKHSE